MNRAPPHEGFQEPDGLHLATISHEGRFWEVHLIFDDTPGRSERHRAHLMFTPADAVEGEGPYRTTTLFIEDSYEGLMRKARGFQDRQLQALLRSVLP